MIKVKTILATILTACCGFSVVSLKAANPAHEVCGKCHLGANDRCPCHPLTDPNCPHHYPYYEAAPMWFSLHLGPIGIGNGPCLPYYPGYAPGYYHNGHYWRGCSFGEPLHSKDLLKGHKDSGKHPLYWNTIAGDITWNDLVSYANAHPDTTKMGHDYIGIDFKGRTYKFYQNGDVTVYGLKVGDWRTI